MCAISPAELAVAPPLYLTAVLIVHAASAAVSGWPSDQTAPLRVLNVHVLPPFDAFHDVAKSGAKLWFALSYWISSG